MLPLFRILPRAEVAQRGMRVEVIAPLRPLGHEHPPVVEGEKEPVVDQGWVECGLGTMGAISAVGLIPVTGGASAVILPALGAGAAAGGASYACIQAGEGQYYNNRM